MNNLFNNIFNSRLANILCIIFFTSFAYSFVLGAPFKTLDENVSIVYNADIKSFANIGKMLTSSFFDEKTYYRPLVSITHMVEYYFFNVEPVYYYLTNIFIHILSAIVLLLIVQQILKKTYFAFFVSLLFAIHPIHWEAVSNVSGRAILLCHLFVVTAFFFYITSVDDDNANLKMKRYFLSLAAFILALLSKESALMLPILLIGHLFFLRENWKESLVTKVLPIIPYFLILIAYVLFRKSMGLIETYHWKLFPDLFLAFFTFLRSVLTSLQLLILPVGLHFDRSRVLFLSFLQTEALLTIFIFIFLITLIFRYRRSISKVVLFCIFWFCVELIPVSQLLGSITVAPGVISTAEHFLYTPSVSIFILLVLIAQHFYQQEKLRKIVVMGSFAFFVFFFLTTIQQNIYSRSAISMFKQSLEQNDKNARIWYSLGLAVGKNGYPKEAEEYFRRSITLNPMLTGARVGLAKALTDQGKYSEGITVYENIKDPGNFRNLINDNLRKAHEKLNQN